MKEIKETKLVETTITKITYQSDDGNYTSEYREKVELYEAYQKSKLMSIDSFYLPGRSNMYYIIKINSREWKTLHFVTHSMMTLLILSMVIM